MIIDTISSLFANNNSPFDKISQGISNIRNEALKGINAANGYTEATKNQAKELIENATAQNLADAAMVQATATTQKLTIAQKAATIATNALKVAASTLITTLAIMGVVKVIEFFINLATAEQRAAEAAEEASNNIKDLQNTFKSQKELVEEISESYEKLSSGVNLETNENISLSTDEYNEFLDINERLAEAFPSVKSGIDENGNSIINLGDNSKSTTEALEELLAKEEELNNFKIAQEIETTWDGIAVKFKEAQENQETFNDKIEESQNALEKLREMSETTSIDDGSNGFSLLGDSNNESDIKQLEIYEKSVNQLLGELDSQRQNELNGAIGFDNTVYNTDGTFQYYANFYALTDEEKDRLIQIIRAQSEELAIELNDSIGNMQMDQQVLNEDAVLAFRDAIPGFISTLKNQLTFKDLEDFDDGNVLQEIAIRMVENLSPDEWPEIDELGVEEYLRQNIIKPLTYASEKDKQQVVNAYNKLLSLDTSNLNPIEIQGQITSLIRQIGTALGMSDDEIIELKVQLGFENVDQLVSDYRNAINAATEKFSDVDWFAWTDENSVNTEEEVDAFIKVINSAESAQEAIEQYANTAKNIEVIPYDWDTLNEEIDSIQGAYQSIQAAQEEYNEYGYVSLDTLQALISLDSEYLSCLIDENGQLQLNSVAYQNLVQAKLAEAEASAVSQAIDELNNLQKRENIQSSYDYVEANALLAQSLSALSGSYSAVMNSAAAAAQAQALSAAIEGAQNRGVDQADIENVISNLNAKLQLIRSTSVGVSESFGKMNNAMNGFEDSTNGATDALDEQKEALEKQKEALEENKEALEDQKEALEEIRDEYDKLYDAIQWFFDEQIDGFDDLIDNLNKANDALQEQLDGLDDILAVVNNVYGDEIDLIQEKIDALDEANDAAERELALEEARQKLEEARNSRTILQYTADRGYIYTTDEKAIKEAEDEVDEANAEKIKAELEDQIKLLEEMRDKWGEIPDAFEKAMQEMAAIEKWGPNYKDFILGSTEDDIADFEGEYSGIQSDMEENNNQIDYYEQQKERIEELKELWEDAKNAYENAQNEARLAAFFGSDYEYQLLNNSTMWSAKFAENYGDISAQIDALEDEIEGVDKQIDAIDEQIDALEEKIEEIKNSASGGSGSGGGGGVGGSGRGLSQYIWTEEDDHAISMGHAMLNQLNAAIDDGKIKYQESADALANYLETYDGFKNGEKSVEDLNTALAELNGVEQEYLGSYTGIIDKTTERLNDASNYTGQIVDYSATATLSFDNLNTAMDTSASNMDNINSGTNDFTSQLDQNVQNISGGLDTVSSLMGDVVIGRNQLEGEVAESIFNTGQVAEDSANNIRTVGDAIKDVTQGTQGINDAANTGMTDVSTAAANATTNVTALGNALGNLNIKKQETVEVANDEINKTSSAVANATTNVTALSNAIANLTTEKQELEGEVNEEVTDVSTSVTESVEKITLLKDALSGLDLAKQELETTINSEVLDTDTLVTEAQNKVTNINNAVNQLITVIEQLKIKLNELHSAMSMLDEVTLSNIIGIIGFGADDEEASLLGAIQAVINKIIGEEGLVYQIQAFNENTDLTPVITQFNGEEASLLSSIQDVINIISVDDNSPCLITTINRITETIQNINLVQGAFANLEGQVQSCVDKVNDLKEAIDKLEDKTITITTNYVTRGAPPTGLATGTANTGRGFAAGTANTIKTGKSFLSGNWGLPYDLPKSMIAELGPEILLRDGIYKLIDKPQFIDLKKGDIIFNHEQTDAILKRGKNSNLKRLSELGSSAISKLTGRSFANGFTMVPYKYPEAFNKLYNSDFMDVASKLLPRNIQGFDSKAFESVKDVKLTKDYHFGDIKINMYGVNDTQGFAVEIKKNFNSILRQID